MCASAVLYVCVMPFGYGSYETPLRYSRLTSLKGLCVISVGGYCVNINEDKKSGAYQSVFLMASR